MRHRLASIVLAVISMSTFVFTGVAHASPVKPTREFRPGTYLFVQNQFSPYGASARRVLERGDAEGNVVSVGPNVLIKAIECKRYGPPIYPRNPQGIRGEVWYKVENRFGEPVLWFADAAVRSVPTLHAPGNRDESYNRLQGPPGCP